jgi:parallel beta-helix repeat protein
MHSSGFSIGYAKIIGNTVNNNIYGILFKNSNSNIITGNIISDNIEMGILLTPSSGNYMVDNTVNNNGGNGILLQWGSNGNNIGRNIISGNSACGINIGPIAMYNHLIENQMTDNRYNFQCNFPGEGHQYHSNDIDTTNTVNGKPIYFINKVSGITIDSSTNAGVVYCIECDDITIKDLVLENNARGVCFYKTNNSRIENVRTSDNSMGIALYCSNSNTISNNIVNDNYYGIYIYPYYYSNSNIIYLNNFIDNINNVHPYDSTNLWNSPEQITYTYDSNTHTNYLGNYYSDYTDTDSNNDGIWDNHYAIDSDNDYYPLVEPFENYDVSQQGKIAFASSRNGNQEVYVINADGSGHPTNLTNFPDADDGDPTWSPDGKQIAFSSDRCGNWKTYVMDADDGSNQVCLMEDVYDAWGPAWSPDGNEIAFACQLSSDDDFEIYTMDIQSKALTQVTDNSVTDSHPAWSPNSHKIVFTSTRDGNHELYVADLLAGTQTRLTDDPAYDDYPEWSPDGSMIVFVSDRDGNQEIYSMNIASKAITRLTYNEHTDKHAQWSPDGQKIIFVSDRDGCGNLDVYVMNADGTSIACLVDWEGDETHPTWSPSSAPDQPPTCAIELQKNGIPIDNINVGEFFDIYVGDSTDDQVIKEVRFSSDESQDGNPTGEWTDWYDWDTSSGDWDAVNKIKAWSFATGGAKEVWAEVKDGDGQADKCSANIYANQLPIAKPVITSPLEITPIKDIYYVGDTIRAEFTIKNEGSASITFDILTVGGRLNGECPIAGCPDFTHKSLTLQPGESYHYEGSLTLHPGNYQFFIAYYIENPTPDEKKLLDENNWNTCVDLGEGLTDEDRRADISVSPINPAPSNLEVRATGELAETEWGVGVYHFLTWNYNYNFDNVKGFVIQEKFVTHPSIFLNPTEINWPYPIGFHDVATVGPSLRGHKIATPIPNINSAHTKEYRIATIFTDNLLSEWSNVATISPSTISPPSKLEATVSKDPLQIKLTWKDRSNNEMGFHIYRWEGLGIGPWFEQAGKEWPLLANVAANVETFIDTDVRSGYTFKYIIKAFNDVDISPSPNGVMVYIPALDEVPPPLTNSPPNILFANLKSPGELRIYDSQNQVTGLINGEIKEEIPDSIYDEHNEIVVVFSSTDTYRHEVVGTDGGSYGLDITSVENGKATTFTATDIPTTTGAIHEYTINWDALSQGEEGVTVLVDSDGDGTFEYIFTADNELTQEEFLSGTDGEPIPEFTTIAIPVAIVLGLIFIISRRKRKEE